MDRNSLDLASSHSSDEDDDFEISPPWDQHIPKSKAVGEQHQFVCVGRFGVVCVEGGLVLYLWREVWCDVCVEGGLVLYVGREVWCDVCVCGGRFGVVCVGVLYVCRGRFGVMCVCQV